MRFTSSTIAFTLLAAVLALPTPEVQAEEHKRDLAPNVLNRHSVARDAETGIAPLLAERTVPAAVTEFEARKVSPAIVVCSFRLLLEPSEAEQQ